MNHLYTSVPMAVKVSAPLPNGPVNIASLGGRPGGRRVQVVLIPDLGNVCVREPLIPLRLYSTATQNTWRRGLALGNAPDARILR